LLGVSMLRTSILLLLAVAAVADEKPPISDRDRYEIQRIYTRIALIEMEKARLTADVQARMTALRAACESQGKDFTGDALNEIACIQKPEKK
jgi:hypothetical protein